MSPASTTSEDFVKRWAGRELTERAIAQSHFIDLCRLLGVPAPTDNPVTDSDYGFEARTDVSASGLYATRFHEGKPIYQVSTGPGGGFVDVWMKGHFCWEYKRPGKHANLPAALMQVKAYKDSLGNPPLLIVSDVDRYEIHTNFTNHPPTTYAFGITELLSPSDDWRRKHPTISPLQVLRRVFDDVEWFRPAKTIAAITEDLAANIGQLAIALRDAGNQPHAVAHFVMQMVFCFFAEDIGLLPKDVFTDLIAKSLNDEQHFPGKARRLFQAMADGGHFGSDTINWFNGGLYKDIDADPVINIPSAWLGQLLLVARADWSSVEPSIMGTLFERSLDPGKRSQIGAHYTSRDDIMLIIEPVVMEPLRRKWVDVQKDVAEWLEQRAEKKTKPTKRRYDRKIENAITTFVDDLGSLKVLDPACGSGNFLYVAIQQLLDLEGQARSFAASPEIAVTFTPRVHPRQLYGIDINFYATELARVSIWIGYLQWMYQNGDSPRSRPILDPLDTIQCRDAILKWADDQGNEVPDYQDGAQCLGHAEWPEADFIIGNPPFLGTKLLRRGLGDHYVETLFRTFRDRIPGFSDLCCYWLEIAREHMTYGPTRVGLLATQGIRGRENRKVLERIQSSGNIFFAISDRQWVLDGANVHISMIGFDNGQETSRELDGEPVSSINPSLTAGLDIGLAVKLRQNQSLGFVADVKAGPFDISWDMAAGFLRAPNPNDRSNLDVLHPWINGRDITSRNRGYWIIDFGYSRSLEDSAIFELPFDYVERNVYPQRSKVNRKRYREYWWLHAEPCERMRQALKPLSRALVTPTLTKHRLFAWIATVTLPDHQVIAFAVQSDYFLGALHAAVHECWARAVGTQLREVESGFRYTPTTCFETFPLPWAPGEEPTDNEHHIALSSAAKELNELRERWLNPPEWIEPIEKKVDAFEDFSDVPEEARELLRQSAIMAEAAKDKNLKKRTLTNLYNARPTWLKLAHKKLDEAVIRAYAEVDPDGEWDPAWAEAYEPYGAGEIVIVRPKDVKGKRTQADPANVIAAKEAAIEKRKEIDEKILANLLRMNLQRAKAEMQSDRNDQ